MKINKKYTPIIEWILAIFLLIICFKYTLLSYGSFSPVKAHEELERTYHYGPSKIVKTLDIDGYKIYLCKYKDWYSADVVKRKFFKWVSEDPAGTPINYSNQLSHTWHTSRMKGDKLKILVYGYVNDSKITTILLEDESKTNSLSYDLDESQMFIFYSDADDVFNKIYILKGLDSNGNIICEEKVVGL